MGVRFPEGILAPVLFSSVRYPAYLALDIRMLCIKKFVPVGFPG
ncbi:hypothetical protein [Dysgonomonas sp. HGC4]|nr:hypothetical protein [Dysgonomonas sp. HGC4]